jgi:cardiolipin synthase A/B
VTNRTFAILRCANPFVGRRVGSCLLIAVTVLCSACVTLNPDVEPAERIPPIITKQRALSEDASDRLLQSALDEYKHDAALRELIDEVRRAASTPLTAGNKVTVLIDGPQTYAAMERAVQSARHHIHVETFIFGADEIGRRFAELLERKHKEGIEVRLLYDSVGSMETPREFFDELRNKGLAVREFRPMNPAETPLIWKIQNRDHRKILIVDGKVGFTGGINIDGTYSSASSSKPGPTRGMDDGWRDTHVRLEGPAVTQLQKLFVGTWNKAGEQTAFTPEQNYFPPVQESGRDLVTIVANDSETDDRSLYATYLAAFTKADSRLWITHAYFAPNEELLAAMTNAVKRGVDVRLIVPGFTDSGIVLQATRSTYTGLLEKGVHIYQLDDAFLHAKSVVIDSALSIVGSANLDMRSFVHNDEANAIVISREVGQRMEDIFRRDQRSATAIDPAKWKKRSVWLRLKEFGARMMGYWL